MPTLNPAIVMVFCLYTETFHLSNPHKQNTRYVSFIAVLSTDVVTGYTGGSRFSVC
jgi:hypothetical protein